MRKKIKQTNLPLIVEYLKFDENNAANVSGCAVLLNLK